MKNTHKITNTGANHPQFFKQQQKQQIMKELKFKTATQKGKSTLFEFYNTRREILLHNSTFEIDLAAKKISLSKSDWLNILKIM